MSVAALIIGDYSSSCSACGGNADPGDTYHLHGGPGGMYDPSSWLGRQNGCGAMFTRVEHRGRSLPDGGEPRVVIEARERIRGVAA